MPRQPKGPRLYLRKRKGRPAVWVIRDREAEHSTECGPGDREGAERALTQYLTGKHEPARKESKLAALRVSDVVNVYLRERGPGVSDPLFLASTAEPVIRWFADKTLADIRGVTCRDYVAWRTTQPIKGRKNGKTVSVATARHDLKTMRAAILHYHREYGPLDAVPIVTLPAPSAPKERWLTWQEAVRLLRAARGNEALTRFILLGLHTGTRSDAVMRLRWLPSTHSGHVDFTAGLVYRKGAGEKETKKKRPVMKIEPRLMQHLKRWHAADTAQGISHVIHNDGESLKKFRRSWGSAVKRAGLGPDVTAHVLRHTAVTWRLRAGHDPWRVAGYVGMSLATLDKVYGHHARDTDSPRVARRR